MKDLFYAVFEEVRSIDGVLHPVFGIGLYRLSDPCAVPELLLHVGNVSSDRAVLEALAERCNRLGLSPLHLSDVIDDFLALR